MPRRATCLPCVSLAIWLVGCNPPPVGIYETTSYDGVEFIRRGDKPLLMDVVVPTVAPMPRPAVLVLHGGGWVSGDRSLDKDMARFLASLGYTAATADYRLYPEGGVYPASVADSLAAVKFLRSHADDYGIDARRVAIAGESAGGQLALLVGMVEDHAIFRDESFPGVRSDVQAVVAIYAPTDLAALWKEGGWITRRLGIGYLGCPPDQCPDKWREASPITHARGDTPPILILHGDQDRVVPISQADRLHSALKAAGAPSLLARVPGGSHGWGLYFNGVQSQRTLPIIAQFLSRSLASAAGAS